MIDCCDAVQRLNLFLDRELTPDDLVEVQGHLDACPHCLTEFRLQAELKRLVRVCVCCDHAPADLHLRVLSLLREE